MVFVELWLRATAWNKLDQIFITWIYETRMESEAKTQIAMAQNGNGRVMRWIPWSFYILSAWHMEQEVDWSITNCKKMSSTHTHTHTDKNWHKNISNQPHNERKERRKEGRKEGKKEETLRPPLSTNKTLQEIPPITCLSQPPPVYRWKRSYYSERLSKENKNKIFFRSFITFFCHFPSYCFLSPSSFHSFMFIYFQVIYLFIFYLPSYIPLSFYIKVMTYFTFSYSFPLINFKMSSQIYITLFFFTRIMFPLPALSVQFPSIESLYSLLTFLPLPLPVPLVLHPSLPPVLPRPVTKVGLT